MPAVLTKNNYFEHDLLAFTTGYPKPNINQHEPHCPTDSNFKKTQRFTKDDCLYYREEFLY
jgi:hypothetical protein